MSRPPRSSLSVPNSYALLTNTNWPPPSATLMSSATHTIPSQPTVSPTPAQRSQPISLHNNTLYLNPDVFVHLTPNQVKGLEALGAQKALEILQEYIAAFLKEKMKVDA